MRGGRVGGTEHVASRAARARAERLWHETVARPGAPESNIARPCTPEDDNSGSTAYLLLSPSPEGGGGTQAAPPVTPSPPPSAARRESQVSGASARRLREMERVAERVGEKRGRATSKSPRHPLNGTANDPSPPRRARDAQAAGALDRRVSPGPDPGPLGRRARGLAPPPEEPRRRHLPERGRPRPAPFSRWRPGSRGPQAWTGGHTSPSAGTGGCGRPAAPARGCWKPSGACSTASGACESRARRRLAPTPPASPPSAAPTPTSRSATPRPTP